VGTNLRLLLLLLLLLLLVTEWICCGGGSEVDRCSDASALPANTAHPSATADRLA
jgi:hypothetical protein